MARTNQIRSASPSLGALLSFFLLLAPPIIAQSQAPLVVEMGEISGEGISQGELDSLSAGILSYVSEMEGFAPAPSPGGQANQAVPAFRLSGKISQRGGDFLFTLESSGSQGGEKRSVSDRFASVNDIVLKARSMTRAVLLGMNGPVTPPEGDSRPEEPRSGLETIAGLWKGDKGIDRVRLGGDGSGSAILSSGHAMRLRVSLRDGRIVVEQDQPGEAAFFASPKYSMETAREIALKARPMRWIFRVSDDGKTLSGMKESVAAQRGTDGILRVDNSYAREAIWTRMR